MGASPPAAALLLGYTAVVMVLPGRKRRMTANLACIHSSTAVLIASAPHVRHNSAIPFPIQSALLRALQSKMV